MLNHGVADDNVHYQHSMLLTRALEENDIQFVQHSYPDENHGLGGVSRLFLEQLSIRSNNVTNLQVLVSRDG